MESLVFMGLGAIVLGWLLQLFAAMKGEKELQTSFVVCYIIGVAILAVDGFSSGQFLSAVINSLALIIAALVIFQTKVVSKKK